MCLGLSDVERSQLLHSHYFVPVKPLVEKIYREADAKPYALDKGFYTDMRVVLEGDMLTKVDRVSMKNSLEARVPFLDSELVRFSQRLPTNFKIKGNNQKYILKETFKDLLPRETLKFRKKGFGVPIDHWMHGPLKAEISDLLAPDYLKEQGIFEPASVEMLWSEHLSGKENHKGKLWNLYVFQKWYLKNFQPV
jgi:asparagine synthase (glutamine-hydrolysing)